MLERVIKILGKITGTEALQETFWGIERKLMGRWKKKKAAMVSGLFFRSGLRYAGSGLFPPTILAA